MNRTPALYLPLDLRGVGDYCDATAVFCVPILYCSRQAPVYAAKITDSGKITDYVHALLHAQICDYALLV